MFTSLKTSFNIKRLQKLASKKLPLPVRDYLEGGSDDEKSLANNQDAFNAYQIIPNCLKDISNICTKSRILGCNLDLPLLISPTGSTRLFHKDAELPGVRAAAEANIFFSLSTFSNETIESVGLEAKGPKMFQIYFLSDKKLNRQNIQRCKDANYDAICLTVDTAVGGNRERDLVSGFTVPPKLTLKSFLQIAIKPIWGLNYLLSGGAVLANLTDVPTMNNKNKDAFITYMSRLLEDKLTWEMAKDMVQDWGRPFAIKGIMSVTDALRAKEIGASAIMISNHGGRQMDGTPAPIEMVQEIRAAVGDNLEIIVDGGIRRGSDILKALALGANACSIGRPYLYGLAAGGQSGVTKTIDIFRTELLRNMALCGMASIQDISPELIRKK